MKSLLVLAVLALVAFFAALYVASETGGEVVTLRTSDADGEVHETRLWIVELGPDLWLRGGDGDSRWLARLRANPEVELERGGRVQAYKATPVPHMGPEVDAAMAEKYGLSDRLIGVIRDPEQSTAVRLDPIGP